MIYQPFDEIQSFLKNETGQYEKYAVSVLDIDFFTRICRRFKEKELDDIMRNIEAFLIYQLPEKAKIWKAEGDDEFLIVALCCRKDELYEILLETKKKFRKQKFARNSDKDYSNITMSFSAGVAAFPVDGPDLHTVIRKSVVGLFLAKAYRRNNVVKAPETNIESFERILYDNDLKVDVVFGSYGEIGSINGPVNAEQARLWEPQAIDVDESGKVYIADQNNNSILIYDGCTVSKIAGTGLFGYSGDGSSGNCAMLNKPTGLTVFNDKLYITDTGNDAVRLLDLKTGIISTFAGNSEAGYSGDGGLATDACLNKPGGVVADNEGNIYINDIANNVIRKVDRQNIITTFAGTGQYGYLGDSGQAAQATFAEIYGLGINRRKGCIYLADYFNHCIREINIKTGIISTVVGIGEEGYSGDGRSAREARLNRPVAVYVDGNDNLYIAESGNHCIRFYEAETEKIYTLVGDGVAGIGESGLVKDFRLANPNGVAIGKGSVLYLLDGANNRLCSIKIGGNKQ
jgi:GGDEF domain-containing protein